VPWKSGWQTIWLRPTENLSAILALQTRKQWRSNCIDLSNPESFFPPLARVPQISYPRRRTSI
jgi:hypothetical protein